MIQKPKKSDHLAWRAFEDRTIVLDLAKQREFHELNEVASYIWSKADGKLTAEEIAKGLEEEFEIDSANAAQDTRDFLADLAQRGLIEWTTDNP